MIMRASILGSFVLSRGGQHRGTWRLRCHVLQIPPKAYRGVFHTKTSLHGGDVVGIKPANGGNSRSSMGWPNKGFMITSSRPGVTKYCDILDQLSKLHSTSSIYAEQSRNPAVVILATPTFASWLENRGFMRKILETLFSTKVAANERPILDVTALVAVVDGLPSEEYEDTGQVTEGFAFLLCNHEIALPGLWEQNDMNATEYQSNHPRPSITFKMRTNSSVDGSLDIDVPLANTLFRNGRAFTLLASKWNRSSGSDVFERIQQAEKKSVTVCPASPDTILPLHLEIPLVPLTPLRRVVSGLGNILRQVANTEGEIVSASQELEASIDSYFEVRSLDKQTATVWALLIPHSIVMNRRNSGISEADPKQIRILWTNTLESSINSYVGHWLLQGHGATLHRVLSGGGGWGLKQGLLSLDPETTLLNSAVINHNLDSSHSSSEDQIQALGNIAMPGSWVQFLISHNDTPNRSPEIIDLGAAGSGSKSASNLSFGCIASTVDDIPQPSADSSTLSDDKDIQPPVSAYWGQFGAMSETGIFIRAVDDGVANGSKIDVPNSEFRLALINRAES